MHDNRFLDQNCTRAKPRRVASLPYMNLWWQLLSCSESYLTMRNTVDVCLSMGAIDGKLDFYTLFFFYLGQTIFTVTFNTKQIFHKNKCVFLHAKFKVYRYLTILVNFFSFIVYSLISQRLRCVLSRASIAIVASCPTSAPGFKWQFGFKSWTVSSLLNMKIYWILRPSGIPA
jgi:hypothetical protein